MFHLRSTWRLPAPPARVWAEMSRIDDWPDWWPGIASTTTVRPGDADGVGQRTAVVVRSPLGYALRFGVEIVEATRPGFARARVVGHLRGEGSWDVEPDGAGSVARIRWDVTLAQPVLATLAEPFAVPLAWAHGRVMAAGERVLTERLRSG